MNDSGRYRTGEFKNKGPLVVNGLLIDVTFQFLDGGHRLRQPDLFPLVDVAINKKGRLRSTLTEEELLGLIDSGEISGGMIPKVQCCCRALDQGIGKAHIIDGRVEHAVLLEIFTDVGIGTQILKQ